MTRDIVVSDTGPVLHLREAGILPILSLTGSVNIAPPVDEELCHWIEQWHLQRPDWLRVVELEEAFSQRVNRWTNSGLLHPGEAGALALALQLKAQWFLTDDSAAREFAASMEIEVHGSLGIILWAAGHGHLEQEQGRSALKALFASSLWVSQAVRKEARDALERILGT